MRIGQVLLTIVCVEFCFPALALAQQLCDLPVSDLSELRSQVQKLPGATPADSRNPDFDVINVGRGQLWNFTKLQHPAHPSVACRTLAERDGRFFVETKLHCRAAKYQCEQLSADYARLDRQMMDALRGSSPKR